LFMMDRNMDSSWISWRGGSGIMTAKLRRCATITSRALWTPLLSCSKCAEKPRNS
ncbi:hypothetical protein M9458_016310, partial [Cirrhinus mrigala]